MAVFGDDGVAPDLLYDAAIDQPDAAVAHAYHHAARVRPMHLLLLALTPFHFIGFALSSIRFANPEQVSRRFAVGRRWPPTVEDGSVPSGAI